MFASVLSEDGAVACTQHLLLLVLKSYAAHCVKGLFKHAVRHLASVSTPISSVAPRPFLPFTIVKLSVHAVLVAVTVTVGVTVAVVAKVWTTIAMFN